MSAIEWLTRSGAVVSKPLFHSPDYDLVADMAGRLVRVEVKTSNRLSRVGNWEVAICTRGGNQSWSGVSKLFDSTACDFLFVHVGDGRRWFIPAARIEGTRGIAVGCSKYRDFEIEPSWPLPRKTVRKAASTIAVP